MEFDLRSMPPRDRYKVLSSCVTPRPIAWVTTRSSEGIVNAAPYSFFNMLGDDPLTIGLGIMRHGRGGFKDTAANILETREFVVNLVDEAHAEAMNITCADMPPEVDECRIADLQLTPSSMVAPPRIATVPASFECRLFHAIETGPKQLAIIAEVVHGHVADAHVEDLDRLYIDTPGLRLISRLHGSGWYGRRPDAFQMDRPTWQDIARRDDYGRD